MQLVTSQRQGSAAKSGLFLLIFCGSNQDGANFSHFCLLMSLQFFCNVQATAATAADCAMAGPSFSRSSLNLSLPGFQRLGSRGRRLRLGPFFPQNPFQPVGLRFGWPAPISRWLVFLRSYPQPVASTVAKTVRLPDLAVVTVYHDFTPLIAGDFAGTLDGFLLRGANRGGPAVAFAHHGPAARSFHDILFNSHIFHSFAGFGLLTKESSFKSFEPSIHCP